MHADLFSLMHHHTDREVLFITIMPAVVYTSATAFNISGILAVFFCGVTISHYTWHSISASARVLSVHNFRIIASTAETLLFVYAGLNTSATLVAWAPSSGTRLYTVLRLAAASLGFILVVRALFVALAVAIVNLWRSYKLTLREALIMWFGGLVRGAMSTALVYSYFSFPGHHAEDPGGSGPRHGPGDDEIVAATVTVVVLSTVAFGTLSGRVMHLCKLPSMQSRLVDIGTLPNFLREDDTSVNSAAVRLAELIIGHHFMHPCREQLHFLDCICEESHFHGTQKYRGAHGAHSGRG
jgi:NhaP-type Na+/H+ or K+/H+ antiporter